MADLTKKTKAQLLEIISDKEQAECKLAARIEQFEEESNELRSTVSNKNAVIEELKQGNEEYAKELLDANNTIAELKETNRLLNKTIETKDKTIDIKSGLIDELKDDVREKQDKIEALETVVEYKTNSLEESYNETCNAKALAETYLDRIKIYKTLAIFLGVTTLVLLLVVIFS